MSARSSGDEKLRVSDVTVEVIPDVSWRSVRAVLTVPPDLAGYRLTEQSVRAQQGGWPLLPSLTRVVEGPAELLLVLDVDVDVGLLAAEQSAAADLLRQLPRKLRTTVLPGGVSGERTVALRSIAGLRPGPHPLFGGLVAPGRHRRLVVVLTGCASFTGVPPALRAPNQAVELLAVGVGCEKAVGQAAALGRGVVRSGLTAFKLTGSADDVARDLLNQYQFATTTVAAHEPVDVAVEAGGVRAVGRISLPPAAHSPRYNQAVEIAAALLVLAAALMHSLATSRQPATRPRHARTGELTKGARARVRGLRARRAASRWQRP